MWKGILGIAIVVFLVAVIVYSYENLINCHKVDIVVTLQQGATGKNKELLRTVVCSKDLPNAMEYEGGEWKVVATVNSK
jgi:hypothetical protein